MSEAFRHDDRSPREQEWLDGPLTRLPWMEPPAATDHLLVLAAHPDDETLGAGGLIATAHARGARVTVLVASDGEASHPVSPTHSPDDLGRLRRVEVDIAVHALAPSAALHFLGLPDGRLGDYTEALHAQVEFFARDSTHIASPWENDRHPDHAACARAAVAAAAQAKIDCWQYPIWAWHWGDPSGEATLPWSSMRRVAVESAERAAKRRAIDAHHSQHTALSRHAGDAPIIGPDVIAHFDRPFEVFVLPAIDDATSPGYFDRLYADTDDPWGLDTRFYEVRKRSLLLDALPRQHFGRAFEPGCATGLLTTELAAKCDEVIAWDIADRAVEQTAKRTADASHVLVQRGAVPEQWPEGSFDLVVLSEVAYYCTDLDLLAARCWNSLADDGVLVACHWRHVATAHPHDAQTVHAALGQGRQPVVDHVEADFLLQVWTGTGRSVAHETGIIGASS